MSSHSEILKAGRELQVNLVAYAYETSHIVAALHVQDKVRMKEILKSLYHLDWDFKDLSDALEEISGMKGWEDEHATTYFYENAENYDWKKNLLGLYNQARDIQRHIGKLCTQLEALGVDLKFTRLMNGRLFLDLQFLETDLKDAQLIS